MWCVYLVIIFITSVQLTKQPAYKIALTQKGFPQYLQYVIDTAPIREFTSCVWVRVFEFSDELTIFAYNVHDKNSIMRLWVEEEGKLIKVSIRGETFPSIAVDLTSDAWHHICLSYQSDFGAWALYLNGRLTSCEAAQNIFGYKLPAGGHFIFGHGASRNGSSYGLEGEIYGVNILLISTIEKKITPNQYYHIENSDINKATNTNIDVQKFMLGQKIALPKMKKNYTSNQVYKPPRNFIKFNTPYRQFEYDIGVDLSPKMKQKNNVDIDDIILPNNKKFSNSSINELWEVLSNNKQFEQFGSHTKELPTISEYETPPPSPFKIAQDNSFPTYNITGDPTKLMFGVSGPNSDTSRNLVSENLQSNLPVIERPPPVGKKNEVYGQWTTSSFAKDVLNYLKSINSFSSSQRKVPETIPLLKISDNFPYPSDLVPLKILATDESRKKYFQHDIRKRESKKPQINIEIIENDLRSLILQEHAKTYAHNVEITNRGKNKMDKGHRLYTDGSHHSSGEISASSGDTVKSLALYSKRNNEENWQSEFNKNFANILPYLQSSEFYTAVDNVDKNEMYTNSLSTGNKWHNIKYHSNILSPSDTNIQYKEINPFKRISFIDNSNNNNKFAELTKYNPEQSKSLQNLANSHMGAGFLYGTDLSKLSSPSGIASLLNNENKIFADQTAKVVKALKFVNKSENVNKFNQHVKIGNALNERGIIGNSRDKNKLSFVGGNENIPDIQRYRSDVDLTTDHVPPSLMPKICEELQPLSPEDSGNMLLQKGRNYGIDFVTGNYKCKEQDIIPKKKDHLLITWSETPVKLFGGAYPKKASKQCGFF